MGSELRVLPRERAGYEVELIWKSPSGEQQFEHCRAIDYSDGGIAVECPAEVPIRSDIIIRADEVNLAALSQVRHCSWQRSSFLLGLQFLAKTTLNAQNNAEPDHYEILRLSQAADGDAIARVYRTLARRFHPDNSETADPQAFLRVNQAWRILSDPSKRASYDRERRNEDEDQPRFRLRSKEFFQGLKGEKNRRIAILCLLYRKRTIDYQTPGMSMLEMERLTGFTREEIGFALWYLREKEMVKMGDNTEYCIGANGVDFVESSAGHPELLAIAAPSLSQDYLQEEQMAQLVPPSNVNFQSAILL